MRERRWRRKRDAGPPRDPAVHAPTSRSASSKLATGRRSDARRIVPRDGLFPAIDAMVVTCPRRDGATLRVPFANVFELEGGLVVRYLIFIDNQRAANRMVSVPGVLLACATAAARLRTPPATQAMVVSKAAAAGAVAQSARTVVRVMGGLRVGS
jgi:hypothetical protein